MKKKNTRKLNTSKDFSYVKLKKKKRIFLTCLLPVAFSVLSPWGCHSVAFLASDLWTVFVSVLTSFVPAGSWPAQPADSDHSDKDPAEPPGPDPPPVGRCNPGRPCAELPARWAWAERLSSLSGRLSAHWLAARWGFLPGKLWSQSERASSGSPRHPHLLLIPAPSPPVCHFLCLLSSLLAVWLSVLSPFLSSVWIPGCFLPPYPAACSVLASVWVAVLVDRLGEWAPLQAALPPVSHPSQPVPPEHAASSGWESFSTFLCPAEDKWIGISPHRSQLITIFTAAGYFTSHTVKNNTDFLDLLALQVSWQPLMLTSHVKDIQAHCFYTGPFDPSLSCPCRAKVAGQNSLWWSDLAFLSVRSPGFVYLHMCLKEPRGSTQYSHMIRIICPSCLNKDMLEEKNVWLSVTVSQ